MNDNPTTTPQSAEKNIIIQNMNPSTMDIPQFMKSTTINKNEIPVNIEPQTDTEDEIIKQIIIEIKNFEGNFCEEFDKKIIKRAENDFMKNIRPKNPEKLVIPYGFTGICDSGEKKGFAPLYRKCANDQELFCLLVMEYQQKIAVRNAKKNSKVSSLVKYKYTRFLRLTVESPALTSKVKRELDKFIKPPNNKPIGYYGSKSHDEKIILLLLDYKEPGHNGLSDFQFGPERWPLGTIKYEKVDSNQIKSYIDMIHLYPLKIGDIQHFEL